MNAKERKDRVPFLALHFDSINERDVPAAIARLSCEDAFSYVVTPNVDHVVRLHAAQDDDALWRSYDEAALCLCDSRILKRLAAISGMHLDLVAGSDLTARLLGDHVNSYSAIAVIGGDSELIERLSKKHQQIRWLHHLPPMGVRTNTAAQDEIVQFVENCPANLFLFAIGSPQSELLCHMISQRAKAQGVALCIGASLEFVTGLKKRAPRWMQKASIEWLFRLLSEPRRLWRRYLVDGISVFRIWWRSSIRGAHPSSEFGSRPPGGG